jgi:2-polyprenyl-6-methoxyphenol hydroxylase-like FAD-dependent oxidoreductase
VLERGSLHKDTVSTHFIHQPGISRLREWGLLKDLKSSGCPPIEQVKIFSGPRSLEGLFMSFADCGPSYCPRRTVLDPMLSAAASGAGADVREGCRVESLTFTRARARGVRYVSPSGRSMGLACEWVIGADGARSTVAKEVGASERVRRPLKNSYLYAYWSGVPVSGGEIYCRDIGAATAFPTNDGLVCIAMVWPKAQNAWLREDPRGGYLAGLRKFASLYDKITLGRCISPVYTSWGHGYSYIRRPYGEGWALVGDAGYYKDHLAALGIMDAFRDAALVAKAFHSYSGGMSEASALARYERERNREAEPLYEFTNELEMVLSGARKSIAEVPRPRAGRILYGRHGAR